jgi:hypothetical protein
MLSLMALMNVMFMMALITVKSVVVQNNCDVCFVLGVQDDFDVCGMLDGPNDCDVYDDLYD